MAREIDLSKPLDAETLAYLRSTRPMSHVDRLIELAGVEDGGDGVETADDGDDTTNAPDGGSEVGDGPETVAEDGSGDNGDPEEGGDGVEDLIGSPTFDPSTHTTDEVTEYLKTATDEERERVLGLERDGKARKTIVG